MASNPDIYGNMGAADYKVPGFEPAQTQRIDAPATAFGAQIGEANQQAGAQAIESGNKLSELTNHFLDIYNDSTARDAVTGASQQLSQAEFEYKQQKGLNAVNAFPVFQQKAAGIMDSVSASMPNVGAQKLFKDQFSRELQGAIFRSGGWAAEQADQAQVNSLQSSMANKIDLMAMHITDPSSRQSNIQSIQDDALQYAHIQGLDPDSADRLVSHNVGEAYANGIRSIVQSDPDKAKQLYDEATNGSFSAVRKDDAGNDVNVQIPYLDDAHRAQIVGEMQGEFRRQEAEQLQTARSYAAQGIDFDASSVSQSMKNAGKSDEYIKSELGRLDQVKDTFGSVDARYKVEKNLKNDEALALSGQSPQGTYDPQQLARAYPREPEKVNDILNEARNLHQVAGFVGGFTTKTPLQIYQELGTYEPSGPSAPKDSFSNAIQFVQQKEGGFVSNDSGKGPTNFGINQEANPDLDVKSLTSDQASQVIKERYWNKIGGDSMSPAFAKVALDGAVNQGVGATQKLIAQANGDPEKLIELRADLYNKIAVDHPDKAQYLSGWLSRLNDLKTDLNAPDQDFAGKSNLYDTMKKAADTYVKQLYDDPAGTIVMKDNVLATQLNDSMQDLSKIGPYVDAMMSRQAAVGVPENKRAALPSNIATSIVNGLTSDPEKAPQAMNDLAAKTGDHWPMVYHSLITQGDLPPYYQSIQQLSSDSSTQRDGTLLARWAGENTKGKTDSDLLGPDMVNTIKKNIVADPAVQNFTQSLYRSGASKTQIDGMVQSVQSLALAKKYYDSDPSAVQNAISSFTSKYDFMPDGGARVPTEVYDSVQQNAQRLLGNIDKMAAIPPAYSTGQHGAPTPSEYFSWVKSSPTWVTSPMENALILKDPMDRIVRDKFGNPVIVPFSLPKPPPLITQPPVLPGGEIAQ